MSATIPVIDISPFREGNPAGSKQVVDAVRAACEDNGFFTIIGHGVSKNLLDRVYRNAQEFFDLPLEEKLKIEKAPGASYKGFTPNRSRTIGRSQDAMLRPSLNESFAMGFTGVTEDPYFRAPGVGTHFEPNVFPAVPADFKTGIVEYYGAMEELSRVIMRIFAAALDIDPRYFIDKLQRHISVLRVVNYPALSEVPAEGEQRAGAHADTGAVTILWNDDPPGRAGLQVRTPSGD